MTFKIIQWGILLCNRCSFFIFGCCDVAIIEPTGIAIDPSEQNIECILNDARRQTTEINNIVMNSLLTGEPHLEEGLLNVPKILT